MTAFVGSLLIVAALAGLLLFFQAVYASYGMDTVSSILGVGFALCVAHAVWISRKAAKGPHQ